MNMARYGLCLDVLRVMAEAGDMDALLAGFAQRVKWVLDFERCTVALLEGQGSVYRQRCLMETRPDMPALDHEPIPLARGVAGRAMGARRVQLVQPGAEAAGAAAEAAEVSDAAMEAGSLAAVLSLPLQVHGEVIGAVTFGSALPDCYGPDDISVAALLATHLALAIAHLQALRALRVSNQELEREMAERVRVEEELRQKAALLARSNAELEHFASHTSHELKEPLRTVAGYVQLLERRYRGKLDDKADHYIDASVRGVKRMYELIDALLAYSRVAMREEPLELVDTAALLDGTLADLDRMIQEGAGEVTRAGLPRIAGNRQLLGQLFQNLVSNALKYRGEVAPRVHVAAERRANEWVFSVRDNGIGIEGSDQERIFEVFTRVNDRGKYPGNGIGLAIGKKIVERHGGRIWVESEPGRGTTFFFTVPDRQSADRFA